MDVLGVTATTEQTADDLVTRNLLEDLRCFVWREDTLSSSLGGQNLITLIINHGLMGYDTIILQWIYLVSKKQLWFLLMIWAELHVIMVTEWCLCRVFLCGSSGLCIIWHLPLLCILMIIPQLLLIAPESSNWSEVKWLTIGGTTWGVTSQGGVSCRHLLSVCQGQQIQ